MIPSEHLADGDLAMVIPPGFTPDAAELARVERRGGCVYLAYFGTDWVDRAASATILHRCRAEAVMA